MYNMLRTRPVATILLCIMALVAVGTYPWIAHPVAGFFFHVSAAGFIGGLADWYAVTALFAKPLGIPYKTELLPRSRDRLIMLARHMIIDELLRPSHMVKVIRRENVAYTIAKWTLSPDGQKHIQTVLETVVSELQEHLDGTPLRTHVVDAVYRGVAAWHITPVLVSLGERLLHPKTSSVLWLHVNKTLQRMLGAQSMEKYIEHSVQAILDRYANESFLRELALVLGGESVSAYRLTQLIQTKGVAYLASQENVYSPLGQWVMGKLFYCLQQLRTNTQWQEFIESKKNSWMKQALEDVDLSGSNDEWSAWILKGQQQIELYAGRVVGDEAQQDTVNKYILTQLAPLLKQLRPLLDGILHNELSRYTGEQMADVVRRKWYYDLQMIRINGSVVGAMLGGVFFVVELLVKGVRPW